MFLMGIKTDKVHICSQARKQFFSEGGGRKGVDFTPSGTFYLYFTIMTNKLNLIIYVTKVGLLS